MTTQVKDIYQWIVLYQNDVLLHEEDAEQGFASVKQDEVKLITLLPIAEGVLPRHVAIPKGATPVFFRRRSIEIDPTQNTSSERPTVHCVGWKRGDESAYLFIFNDGSTLLTNDLQAV